MATQRITFSEWLPDTPSTGTGLQDIHNSIPLISGYAPLRTSQKYSGSASENLNNVFAGKFGANIQLFAGGETDLFKLDSGTLALDAVSRSSGYSSVNRWSFVQFGQTVLAANGSDKIQAWTIGSSIEFDNVSANAPVAKYLAVVRDFIVGAHLDNGSNANKLQWSDINDETNWVAGNASQSDFQIISDGGNITGITGGEFGLVLLEKAIYRMTYVGSPYFFQFDAIARGMGCLAGGSVAQFAGITYFLSDDGFYSCDGKGVTPIGIGKIDKFFFNSVSLNDIDSMSSAVDPENKIIVWNYKDTSGNRSLLIYNFVSQKWSKGETTSDYVAPIATSGVSLDSLDSAYNVTAGSFVVGKQYTIRTVGTTDFTLIGAVANTVGVLFTATGIGSGTGVAIDMQAAAAGLKTLDTLVTSLDDRSLIGGKYLFAGTTDDYITIFSGDYATATFTTGDIEAGYNSVVQLARPQVQDGSASIAVSSRRGLDDGITFSSDVAASNEGRVSLRSAGRYHRIRLTPTGNWTIAIAVDVDFADQGGR